MPNSTKFTRWEIGKSMLELQQEYSELSPYKQIQRKINANSTEYFFSFSNFKILHLLIKSFVIPTLNRVFGSSKHHFLKRLLKKLEKLKKQVDFKQIKIKK